LAVAIKFQSPAAVNFDGSSLAKALFDKFSHLLAEHAGLWLLAGCRGANFRRYRPFVSSVSGRNIFRKQVVHKCIHFVRGLAPRAAGQPSQPSCQFNFIHATKLAPAAREQSL
jgi:hypothetical protein